ncbi:MAG: CPBP family intramembrane metalloprotease [Oscillospiraceae bacterium]|nr:CPBP family intramembrane metalloprotease [Oscillospiraceae bacterium]
MKNKNIVALTGVSFAACALHYAWLQTPLTLYAYASALKCALFLACPIMYFALAGNGSLRSMFAGVSPKAAKLSFAAGLCVFALIWLLFFAARPFLSAEALGGAFGRRGITEGNFIFVFLYIILINAALEEIFFRGFVFMTLCREGVKRFAHAYSCLLFALYHAAILDNAVSPPLFALCMAGLAAAGLFFNILTAKCGGITASLIVHVAANAALNLIVAAYYLPPR